MAANEPARGDRPPGNGTAHGTAHGAHGPRCAAIVGPYLVGKTTLLESLLAVSGAIGRKGKVVDGNTVGDASAEARERGMSTEMNIASTSYLGDDWTFLDCPGSVEFQQEARHALMVADAAVVVCEPSTDKAAALAPLFRFLDDHSVPHFVFVNKVDQLGETRVRDLLEALQEASDRPLILRQVPIRDGETVTGYVDLVSERAYRYKEGGASDLVSLPETVQDREAEARQSLLESLADFDDRLLEQLLEDVVPPTEAVYQHLAKAAQDDRIVPVFIGSALHDHGVRRLLKALRHETPDAAVTALRSELDLDAGKGALATTFKTFHLPHTGKLSVVRLWRGSVADGTVLNDARPSALYRIRGAVLDKLSSARAGEVVGLGRLDDVATGSVLADAGPPPEGLWPPPPLPLYALAVEPERREDEVKLTAALARLSEEDPSYRVEHNPDTRELLLRGQGEIHLKVAIDRLKNRFNIQVTSRPPRVPYRETIRKPVQQHARHKKQSGGHGQFGDVQMEIAPLPRGSGFSFSDRIVGGRVPRQYIPAVESGVKEYLDRGPLGFPVVDVAVTLTDGQYHSVDSSDQAFRTAAQLAMREAMPKAEPVLLEPIHTVTISAPGAFTSNIQGLVSARRGQILGFAPKEGWKGWDETQVNLPEAELGNLIVELRSLTQGVGTFEYRFDHLQELTGKLAERIVQQGQATG